MQCSLPDSTQSGDQPPSHGSCDESSWIEVEKSDAEPTLWVPDHAVNNCANCETEFWIANRKHHCRYVLHYTVNTTPQPYWKPAIVTVDILIFCRKYKIVQKIFWLDYEYEMNMRTTKILYFIKLLSL